MTAITGTIQALTGQQAIRVLALTLDHDAELPDPPQLRALDAGLRDALTASTGLSAYTQPVGQAGDPGDLAKATLLYLADTRPGLTPVITQAIGLPEEGTKFDPATLAVGALVVLALQTEIKLTRNAQGKWSFTLHKHPLRDSALAQVISKLLSIYGPGRN